ncbi:MAG: helix-hairpin-helix domain-containing protein [Bacteroidetes bacterium]|nr:helix-hairpin-helix domain-containing protein [Bacteroidota bacterium]
MRMGRLNKFFSNTFHFNKQERNGVFVLICIIAILIAVRLALPYMFGTPARPDLAAIDFSKFSSPGLKQKKYHYKKDSGSVSGKQLPASIPVQHYVFDPNTVSYDEAIQLGFPSKTARILVNFREKGGYFKTAVDLKKLYGMNDRLYKELEPYILVHNNSKATTTYTTNARKPGLERKTQVLELNTADSVSLVALKAIGPALAHRIIKYRTLLGGFHSLKQLSEIYGLRDSVVQLNMPVIHLDVSLIHKLGINTIGFNELKKHPYFSFQATQAIINYRNKHGKLNEADIRNLGIFTPEKLERLLPYLDFN